MVSIFKKFIGSSDDLEFTAADTGQRVKIATCALLMAVASVDEITDNERNIIIGILEKEFNLTSVEAQELMSIAAKDIDDSIDYWKFTNTLVGHLTEAERIKIMENIWRVVYADGRISGHEDMIVHKFSFLIDLRQDQMIAAKSKIRSELGLDRQDPD